MEIFVDIFKQQDLLSQNGLFNYDLGIPTFPLNTDGIDPSGTNVTIRNVIITNWDDAVAVKPANSGNKIATCAQNILVENALVYFSVGMTIGSVPPNTNYACIKDVTFRNVTMILPIKAIYVKTNPGDGGSGIIANILYEDFDVYYPIWWGIYIGP
jgi:polygalacturonase